MVKEKVYNYLNGLGMEYEVVDHPAAVTTELADFLDVSKVTIRRDI